MIIGMIVCIASLYATINKERANEIGFVQSPDAE